MTLGDRDDVGEIRNAPIGGGLDVTLDGGAGNDRLSANTGAIDGGPGDDVLDGTFTVAAPASFVPSAFGYGAYLAGGPGADVIRGKAGWSHATYASRSAGVRVTLDATPNDGAPGERDDVRTPDVQGGAGPDTITGSAARNILLGSCGADRLDGAGGDDTIAGNAGADAIEGAGGDDVIYSGDGPADLRADCAAEPANDRVACGAGDDLVIAGAGDEVAADCERVYLAGQSAPRLAISSPPRVRLAGRSVAFAVGDATPAEPAVTGVFPVSGTVDVQAAKGTPAGRLGRATLPALQRKGNARVAIRLSRAARAAIRRRAKGLAVS